jgi:hypothetical protein
MLHIQPSSSLPSSATMNSKRSCQKKAGHRMRRSLWERNPGRCVDGDCHPTDPGPISHQQKQQQQDRQHQQHQQQRHLHVSRSFPRIAIDVDSSLIDSSLIDSSVVDADVWLIDSRSDSHSSQIDSSHQPATRSSIHSCDSMKRDSSSNSARRRWHGTSGNGRMGRCARATD